MAIATENSGVSLATTSWRCGTDARLALVGAVMAEHDHETPVLTTKSQNVPTTATAECLPFMEEISRKKPQVPPGIQDFNDTFPDHILLHIFQELQHDGHLRVVAQVCKRWYTLAVCMQLKKREIRRARGGPDLHVLSLVGRCAKFQMVTLNRVEEEWKLAKAFLGICKCHTHTLEISDCSHASDRAYALISAFISNLKTIKLQSCFWIQDSDLMEILHENPRLRSLHLSLACNLRLTSVAKTGARLENLHVDGCSLVTGGTILAILKGVPNLKSLCLTDMRIPYCWERAEFKRHGALKLQSLELKDSDVITDDFLHLVSRHLPKLRRLDLSDCANVSDSGLRPLLTVCGRELQSLTLSGCLKISDVFVGDLCNVAGRKLLFLSLAGTSITNDSLRMLVDAEAATLLRQLCLAGCSNLTEDGLKYILALQQRRRKNPLRTLDLQGCSGISLYRLKELWPKMVRKTSSFNPLSFGSHTYTAREMVLA